MLRPLHVRRTPPLRARCDVKVLLLPRARGKHYPACARPNVLINRSAFKSLSTLSPSNLKGAEMALRCAALPTLDSMVGDTQARCVDFFEAYAQDLPPPLDAELRAIAAQLFTVHKRARLGELFKVLQGDAETTIGHALPPGEDPVGWRKAIESQAGFEFAGASVPASSKLVKQVAPAVESKAKLSKAEQRLALGTSTISDDLEAAGEIPDDPIDESCFAVFTTDYANTTVDKDELDNFIDAIITQFAEVHGKTNLGAPLLRKLHAQAHRRVKYLPRRGTTAGKDRRFFSMIYDKTVNRSYVRAFKRTNLGPCSCHIRSRPHLCPPRPHPTPVMRARRSPTRASSPFAHPTRSRRSTRAARSCSAPSPST